MANKFCKHVENLHFKLPSIVSFALCFYCYQVHSQVFDLSGDPIYIMNTIDSGACKGWCHNKVKIFSLMI